MTKKIPLGIALAFVFIAIAATAALTVTLTMRSYNAVISDLPEREKQYKSLAETDELVRAEYYGEIDSDALNAGIAQAYIEALGDEYSHYMTAAEYSAYQKEQEGKILGTGITGEYASEGSVIKITAVAEGSPASNAGITAGDMVFAIGGKQITEENEGALRSSLSEAGNGKLEIKYKHDGEAEENTVKLAREYTAPTVKYSINGEIGYIEAISFNAFTAERFSEVLAALKKAEINKFIIDLRGNSSGDIASGAAVTDLIVPLATEGSMSIATVNRANGETVEIFTADSASFSCKAAVLVDSETSGAAELLACDLRDYGFAVLIGEKTAGRGIVQKLFELDNGDAILLSVGKITPYISESYNEVGLSPDIAADNGSAYDTAAAYLLGK